MRSKNLVIFRVTYKTNVLFCFLQAELAESYESQINDLLAEHGKTKNGLEIQIKEALELAESTKTQSEIEKAALEKQYRDKVSALEADHKLIIENHAKSNDDTTERMQKEIESVQLVWQEGQHKLISKLQNEHELAIQSLQSQHHSALELLEFKLTAAVDEANALRLKQEVNFLFYRKFIIVI